MTTSILSLTTPKNQLISTCHGSDDQLNSFKWLNNISITWQILCQNSRTITKINHRNYSSNHKNIKSIMLAIYFIISKIFTKHVLMLFPPRYSLQKPAIISDSFLLLLVGNYRYFTRPTRRQVIQEHSFLILCR